MPRYGFTVQWLFSAHDGRPPQEPDENVLQVIDRVLELCRQRGLHLSLNLHRAPGYVITGWESEPYNLWADAPAQDAFTATWKMFAKRYAGTPAEALSFDLVNEPPALGLRGFTREAHEAVIRRGAGAIRAVDSTRPLAIDGLDGENLTMPELADLGAVHSARGYQPMRREGAWFEQLNGFRVDRRLLELLQQHRVPSGAGTVSISHVKAPE